MGHEAQELEFSFEHWLKSSLSLLVISFASSRIGLFFPKIKMPLLSGYIITGIIAGPDVLNLIEHDFLRDLFYVTQFALAFIAFSAGSELYLPELREMFKLILWVTVGIAGFMLIIATPAIFGMLHLHVFIIFDEDRPAAMLFACALLTVSVMVSMSPATTIAVVKETRAKGPFTSAMLGIIVVCDVVVLVLFALSTGITRAQEGGGFSPVTLVSLFGEIALSIFLGYLFGKLLVFLLWVPKFPGHYFILPLGYAWFYLESTIADLTEEYLHHDITIEPLLICITAGYIATNQSSHRIKFLKLIQTLAPYCFIPFFTLSGANLKLGVMAKGIGFALFLFVLRTICIAVGAIGGGLIAKADKEHNKHLWLTFIAQSGVSIGLASKIFVSFPGWGEGLATTIISVILINVLVGPILCRLALSKVGESRTVAEAAADTGESEGPPQKVFVLGVDCVSLGIIYRLLCDGLCVIVSDIEPENLKYLDAVQAMYDDAQAVAALEAEAQKHGAAAHGHEKPKGVLERRIMTQLDREGLSEALKDVTKDITKKNTIAMISMLSHDENNFRACHYFKHFVQVKRIVTRVMNVGWRDNFTELDVVPISFYGLDAQFVYKLVKTPPAKAMTLIPGKATATMISSLARREDQELMLATASEKERDAYKEIHRDAPFDKIELTFSSFGNKVDRVHQSRRDEYLATIGLREQDEHDIEAEEKEMHAAAFGAGGMRDLLVDMSDDEGDNKPMLVMNQGRSDEYSMVRSTTSSSIISVGPGASTPTPSSSPVPF